MYLNSFYVLTFEKKIEKKYKAQILFETFTLHTFTHYNYLFLEFVGDGLFLTINLSKKNYQQLDYGANLFWQIM